MQRSNRRLPHYWHIPTELHVSVMLHTRRNYRISSLHTLGLLRPVWARGRCRISPPRFLAECCKKQLNLGSFVMLYFRLCTFSDLYWVCYLYFPVLFCSSVSVKWLAVKTASEMTYIVSSGALNATPTNQPTSQSLVWDIYAGRV